MKSPKQMPTLPKFSIDEFVEQRVAYAKQIQLLAEAFSDEDHLVLRIANGDGSVYRVPKTSAILEPRPVDESSASGTESGLHLVTLERNAPCLRLTASTVEGFFSPVVRGRASVAFRANGEGDLSYGSKTVSCLGKPGLEYTRDLTVQGIIDTDKFRRKYSNEFNVYMDFAILIMGLRGIYIHEGADNIAENGGTSAGCIHLAPGNAEDFYNYVSGPTRITISYPW